MNKKAILINLATLAFSAAVLQSRAGAPPQPGGPNETAILHVVQRFNSAWNKADTTALANPRRF